MARDDLADSGRAGEVHAAHCRVGNHCLHHGSGICRSVGDEIDYALGQAGFLQRFNDQAMGGWAKLRPLEYHGVAAGQRHGDGPHAQDDGRIPWGHAQHHACGLAQTHGQAARHVRGDYVAGDLGGQRCGLQQGVRRQVHVEPGPQARGAGFSGHGGDEGGGFGFQRVGGFGQQRAAFAGAGGGPGRERLGSGFDGGDGVLHGGRRSDSGDRAVQRVAALKRGTVAGGDLFAVDQKGNAVHGLSPGAKGWMLSCYKSDSFLCPTGKHWQCFLIIMPRPLQAESDGGIARRPATRWRAGLHRVRSRRRSLGLWRARESQARAGRCLAGFRQA